MDHIAKELLAVVSEMDDMPAGAHNIRLDGKSASAKSTDNIRIEFKKDGKGIDIYVKEGTKGETVHIPAIIAKDDFTEVVYNDFHIGPDCQDILIVAGCGIHNCGSGISRHDGIHSFDIGKNSRVKYVEKHYGSGDGDGERVINPVTEVTLAEGAYFESDTVQIEGVDSTDRVTRGRLADGSTLIVKEKLMTSGSQTAKTEFIVDLDGKGSSTNVMSRSVAKGASKQIFLSRISGNNECMGHSECDAIIMDDACVQAIPEITANHVDASLIHEAAIGKIAGEQIMKLMTLGLSQSEAEKQIVNGFLK